MTWNSPSSVRPSTTTWLHPTLAPSASACAGRSVPAIGKSTTRPLIVRPSPLLDAPMAASPRDVALAEGDRVAPVLALLAGRADPLVRAAAGEALAASQAAAGRHSRSSRRGRGGG